MAVLVVLFGGNAWWSSEAHNYGQSVYRPTEMTASLDGANTLMLRLTDSGWLRPPPGQRRSVFSLFRNSVDNLVPDHDHLMHLYVIREPGLDMVYHLHPDQVGTGVFRLQLPRMQPGDYRLYADIVHANGFPETPCCKHSSGGRRSRPATLRRRCQRPVLPIGCNLRLLRNHSLCPTAIAWNGCATTLRYTRSSGMPFRFRLTDAQGRAPKDMALYMGMLGHAAFVKTDGTVFAHIHPMGTSSMAAINLAQNGRAQGSTGNMAGMDMSGMDMAGMDMPQQSLPNEVSFPYGFPAPGRYRIFVQMKHGATIETGVFDAVAQ